MPFRFLGVCMKRSAFSLVELSVVLVILGLLTGGIIAGVGLMRAAELRSVSNDVHRFTTAINLFREKYQALPGDFATAQSYWGVATNCPGDASTPSTNAATCNGDGDWKIEHTGVATSHEHMRAWQHLSNAGFIEGQYTGVPSSAQVQECTVARNCPGGRMPQIAYSFATYPYVTVTNDPTYFIGDYTNLMVVGKTVKNGPLGAGFTPSQAWLIDQKLDDGKPGLGSVKVPNTNGLANCTTSTAEETSEYNVSYNQVACLMLGKAFQQQ